jgi:hypothetical protein
MVISSITAYGTAAASTRKLRTNTATQPVITTILALTVISSRSHHHAQRRLRAQSSPSSVSLNSIGGMRWWR